MPIVLENIYSDDNIKRMDRLNGVSLEMTDGEFTGLIGGKGSGAGTLVYIIGRAYAPMCGNVKIIDGNAVCVFERPERFLSESSVEKQLSRQLPASGLSDSERTEKVKAALEAVGLDYDTLKAVPPLSLTLGEMRLVAIAEALMLECEAIVLDDPTESMSPQWSKRLFERLKILNDKGITVVVASDDTKLLAEYAKRVIIMKNGNIELDGSAKSLLTDFYALLRLNVDVPETVMCARMLRERGVEMPDNVLTYSQLIDRLKIIMWRKAL